MLNFWPRPSTNRILRDSFPTKVRTLLTLACVALPGTPVGQLFNRGMFLQPLPPGLRQVMSPRPNLFPAPASLRASFQIVDENILLYRDAEELSAQRVTLEAEIVMEESLREEQLSRELREIHPTLSARKLSKSFCIGNTRKEQRLKCAPPLPDVRWHKTWLNSTTRERLSLCNTSIA